MKKFLFVFDVNFLITNSMFLRTIFGILHSIIYRHNIILRFFSYRLASGLKRSNRTRPMSAHETRHGNESIFAMRQRHWEGLIAGKKSLHRGQLLPGSSTSDEDPNTGEILKNEN